MTWCEAEVVCRRHPNETPQPGICPSCLRERLSRIGTAGNSRIFNKTSCSSSNSFPTSPVYYYYFSSASSSGASSPSRHRRVASDVIDSIYMAISGTHGLKKSRSMAYVPRSNGERDNHRTKTKKKGGFWNKLLIRYNLKKV
ncbi:hypothetical protein ACS0TY_028770 [Phlomoides rotata]